VVIKPPVLNTEPVTVENAFMLLVTISFVDPESMEPVTRLVAFMSPEIDLATPTEPETVEIAFICVVVNGLRVEILPLTIDVAFTFPAIYLKATTEPVTTEVALICDAISPPCLNNDPVTVDVAFI
jgi:hypothetical protein